MTAAITGLLQEASLPRDALPYTDEFDRLKGIYERENKAHLTDADFWLALSSIGKGGLGVKGRKKVAPRTPSLSDEEQLEILRLMPDGIGNRDHLPYTSHFDEMHRRFRALTGKKLTKHEFWRAVSRVAKLSRKPQPLFETAPIGELLPELVQFLERTNPWWKAQPGKEAKRYKRWAFDEVMVRLRADIAPVVALRGPRRIGKSTIQDQVIEHLLLIENVSPRRILRVQFDDVPGLGSLLNPVEAIVRWFEANVLRETLNSAARRGEPAYLLFDELQNVSKWSEQLKSLVDHSTVKTFVTGSSALRISRGRDNLAGRMTPIELGAMRLSEVAGIRGLRELPLFSPASALEDWKAKDFWKALTAYGRKHARIREEAFAFFSQFGGYPLGHVAIAQDPNLLRQQLVAEVVTKTIEFDAVRRGHGAQLDQRLVKETFRLLCRFAGQHVRPKRLADEIGRGLQSDVAPSRVAEAISFLCDALLIHRVPPLEMLLKKNEGEDKYCVCDHFVRNGILQETIPLDPAVLAGEPESVSGIAGHLMESVIGYFLHGLPGLELAWWPGGTEPEIDFVVSLGTQRLPVEVKYRRGSPRPDDYNGLESFCAKPHYHSPFGLLLTQDFSGELGNCTIAMPASTLLLVR